MRTRDTGAGGVALTMEQVPEIYRPTSKHPMTGELFSGCLLLDSETQMHEFRCGPPSAPTRELYDYPDDSDEPVYIRDLTDKEFLAAQRDYTRASKVWAETQGVHRMAGATEVRGTFVTESGARAEGIWEPLPKGWFWTHYSMEG